MQNWQNKKQASLLKQQQWFICRSEAFRVTQAWAGFDVHVMFMLVVAQCLCGVLRRRKSKAVFSQYYSEDILMASCYFWVEINIKTYIKRKSCFCWINNMLVDFFFILYFIYSGCAEWCCYFHVVEYYCSGNCLIRIISKFSLFKCNFSGSLPRLWSLSPISSPFVVHLDSTECLWCQDCTN